MATFETPVQTFHVEYRCDECKDGFMRRHGEIAWLETPIKYPHKCTNLDCGHEQTFLVQYPHLSYKEL